MHSPQTTLDRERELMENKYAIDAQLKQLEASVQVDFAKGLDVSRSDYNHKFAEREERSSDINTLQTLKSVFETYQLKGGQKNRDALLAHCRDATFTDASVKKLVGEVTKFIEQKETHLRSETTLENIEEKIIPSDRKELCDKMLREVQSKIREEKSKIEKAKIEAEKMSSALALNNLKHFEIRLNNLLKAEASIKSYQINKGGNYGERELLNEIGPIRKALYNNRGQTTKKFSVQENSLLGKFKNKVTERLKPTSLQVIDHIRNMIVAKSIAEIRKTEKRNSHPGGT